MLRRREDLGRACIWWVLYSCCDSPHPKPGSSQGILLCITTFHFTEKETKKKRKEKKKKLNCPGNNPDYSFLLVTILGTFSSRVAAIYFLSAPEPLLVRDSLEGLHPFQALPGFIPYMDWSVSPPPKFRC